MFGRRDWLKQVGAVGLGAMGLGSPARAVSRIELEAARAKVLSKMVSLPPTPGSIQGPYYVNSALVRQDITEGRPGLPVRLFLRILDATTCQPIPGAVVDVWQADADGFYSGFQAQGTQGQTWMRGIQMAGSNGFCWFDTVFPGRYPGRTAHLHLKVRPNPQTELTTQLYFDELIGYPGLDLMQAIYQWVPPYDVRGPSPMTNQNDFWFLPETAMPSIPNPNGTLSIWSGLVIAIL